MKKWVPQPRYPSAITKGAKMAGSRNKKDSIYIDKALLRSDAFRSLNKWSMLVYLDFLRMRKMHWLSHKQEWIIENNGELVYPYATAELKKINRRNFRNAIDELQAKGFLDISEYGSGGHNRKETKYKIDFRWRKYGKPEFEPPQKPRRKDTREGRGWATLMADPVKKKQILQKRKNKSGCQK